jgi:multimeric flavodoxin WrbA
LKSTQPVFLLQASPSNSGLEILGKDVHEGRFTNPDLMEVLDTRDGIVFGCATYMGSASAIFKAFLEAAFLSRRLEQRWKISSP